ncbi:hypothetical protein OG758_00575 [Streptomyces sp. NBC_01474]|uniref:hypothetical protein n=1 Tax=Streptomyces sp. NBC_01474 TaxID=2903880 RepID=UPI002DDA1B07|nr:hypothetical protein [Streptomyces sp. NBC_01474]WSD92855.1 hypothetical protein OG758_00575 [Streptomyces sp. NBC_01474]
MTAAASEFRSGELQESTNRLDSVRADPHRGAHPVERGRAELENLGDLGRGPAEVGQSAGEFEIGGMVMGMWLEAGGDVFDQAEQLRVHGLGIGMLGKMEMHPGDAPHRARARGR